VLKPNLTSSSGPGADVPKPFMPIIVSTMLIYHSQPIDAHGCPELAFWTASAKRKRMALTQIWSSEPEFNANAFVTSNRVVVTLTAVCASRVRRVEQ